MIIGKQVRLALAAMSCVGLLIGCAAAKGDKTGVQAPGQPLDDFVAGSFSRSTQIDNPWMPLTPGTRFVYEGTTIEDDGTAVPHRVEINVTDLTKVIGGVRTVITWDLDYSDGELVEAELAFFAQDSSGTIWRVGEYPEEYDGGKFVAAPAWIHGFEDARAGIMMKARPELGTSELRRGVGAGRRLDRSGAGGPDGPEDLRPRGLLRGRAGDRRDQAGASGTPSSSSTTRAVSETSGSGGEGPAKRRKRRWN